MTSSWYRLTAFAAEQREDERHARSSRVLALLIVAVGILDVLSTHASLAAGNVEGNPIMAYAQASLGIWWVAPKLLVHLFVAWLLLWLPTRRMVRFSRMAIGVYTLIIITNFLFAGMA